MKTLARCSFQLLEGLVIEHLDVVVGASVVLLGDESLAGQIVKPGEERGFAEAVLPLHRAEVKHLLVFHLVPHHHHVHNDKERKEKRRCHNHNFWLDPHILAQDLLVRVFEVVGLSLDRAEVVVQAQATDQEKGNQRVLADSEHVSVHKIVVLNFLLVEVGDQKLVQEVLDYQDRSCEPE